MLARKYDALVFVDDCHATGFLGPTGRGTAEYWGVEDQVGALLLPSRFLLGQRRVTRRLSSQRHHQRAF
eukprot:638263-Pyramimonas_sp.AAC.2